MNKPKSHIEVYNDRDGDIVQFFDVLREREDDLRAWLDAVPWAKDLHDRWGRKWYDGWRPEDEVMRAGVFFFLRNTQYAGKYKTFSGFRSTKKRNQATMWQNNIAQLEEFAHRLRNVQIENRDYEAIFNRFDAEETLFYCDPPYVAEGDDLYRHGEFDHETFVDELTALEGRWMLSYMDLPDGLEQYHVVEKGSSQFMNVGHDERREEATERLVMNYDPNQTPMMSTDTQAGLQTFAGGTDD